MHTYMHARACMYVHTCTHACTHAHTQACTHACMHTRTHTNTHTHTHTHTLTHTHTHTQSTHAYTHTCICSHYGTSLLSTSPHNSSRSSKYTTIGHADHSCILFSAALNLLFFLSEFSMGDHGPNANIIHDNIAVVLALIRAFCIALWVMTSLILRVVMTHHHNTM